VLVLKEAVATPFEVLTGTGLPALLPSIWNCTVPVGVPAPGAAARTVAVKVTPCPDVDGLAEELTCVLAFALPTVAVWEPLLPVKVPSPLYVAVMVCAPTASVFVVNEAVVMPPLVLTGTALPALTPSTRNCTLPVGVPLPEL
jgi:hypothetical protein